MSKEKIIYPANRASKVKLGVKPRKSTPKMVTIKNKDTGEVMRVSKDIAEVNVESNGWMFCSKSEFKQK